MKEEVFFKKNRSLGKAFFWAWHGLGLPLATHEEFQAEWHSESSRALLSLLPLTPVGAGKKLKNGGHKTLS